MRTGKRVVKNNKGSFRENHREKNYQFIYENSNICIYHLTCERNAFKSAKYGAMSHKVLFSAIVISRNTQSFRIGT